MDSLQKLSVKRVSSAMSTNDIDELVSLNIANIDAGKIINSKINATKHLIMWISRSRSLPLFITASKSEDAFHEFIVNESLVAKFLEKWINVGSDSCDFRSIYGFTEACQLKLYPRHDPLSNYGDECNCKTGIHKLSAYVDYKHYLKYISDLAKLSSDYYDELIDEATEQKQSEILFQNYEETEKSIPYEDRPSTMYCRLRCLFRNDNRLKIINTKD